jgi:replication factor A1
MSVDERTTQIVETFGDHGVEVPRNEVREELIELHEEYQVPLDEAERKVTNDFAEQTGVELSGAGVEGVGTIDADEEWLTVEAEVVDLWDPSHESIAQVGLVGDETGTIKFVAFETSDLRRLEEGASYRLENVVTEEYQGNYSIKLNRNTVINELDESIDVGDDAAEVTGALVAVQQPSGLIKRCPAEDCSRVLQDGRCSEHGEVDGEFDLRIKAVLDDGTDTQAVIFDAEATEALTGIDIAKAKEIAMDALDMDAVIEQIRPQILGQYFSVTGREMGRYVLIDEFTANDERPDHTAVLENARSISHE